MRRLRQSISQPRRHGSQWPQCPPNQPTPTRCPTRQPATPAPSASITPAISCPGMRGKARPGICPSTVRLSLWQTPQASTRTRTSPRAGSGTSRSTSSSGPPARATCTARIFAIAFSWCMSQVRSCAVWADRPMAGRRLARQEPECEDRGNPRAVRAMQVDAGGTGSDRCEPAYRGLSDLRLPVGFPCAPLPSWWTGCACRCLRPSGATPRHCCSSSARSHSRRPGARS